MIRSGLVSLLCALVAQLLFAKHAAACPGMDHDHGLAPRSYRYATQPSPGTRFLRPLTWGEVNIVHTTDIHGWYQGHLHSAYPEPNYSGDWGDFSSFVSHLRSMAKRKGVDLILVDSGDLHDGAGLSDGFPPDQVDGQTSNAFWLKVHSDSVASVGNHELYKYNVALDTYQHLVPHVPKYLGSNVNISIYDEKLGRNVSHPFGKRYVKWKTDLGRRVTSIGVLFHFTGQDKGITVQDPKDMVKESWFADAISEAPDFFLLPGHMPVTKDEWPTVVNAIRAMHPKVPIMILGGHTHVRSCTTYDEHSVGLESGRYLETIGWLSANLTKSGDSGNLSFSRSYIDANRRNYAYHLGLTKEDKLDTKEGRAITRNMTNVATAWNLTQVYGTARQSYFLDRVPISSNDSLLNLLENEVLPTVISTSNKDRAGVPNFVLANSGAQRFDLYAGDFTKNDQYIVSPFTDAFLYLQDVPYKYANQILEHLNRQGAYAAKKKRSGLTNAEETAWRREEKERYKSGEVEHIYRQWRASQQVALSTEAARDLEMLDAQVDAQRQQSNDEQGNEDGKTLGYVTKDDCPGRGDDTEHVALPYFSTPDYVASPVTGSSTALTDTDKVDVILVDFIASSVVKILNSLQDERSYTMDDAKEYNSLTTQDLYPLYATAKWR